MTMKPAPDALYLRLIPSLAAFLVAVLMVLSGCAQEGEPPSDPTATDLSDTTATDILVSGRDMYEAYCASCHGPEARGDGPVAELLTVPPPDLTQIRARLDGSFPVDELYRMIDGREEVQAHGTREMPVWGNIWEVSDSGPQSDAVVEQRINLLIEYLRSIQAESQESSSG